MKKLFFLMTILIPLIATAQEDAIMFNQYDGFYAGIPNSITVVRAKVPCEDITIEVDKGEVKWDAPCKCTIFFKEPGEVFIGVIDKAQMRRKVPLISRKYKVKPFPEPIANVAAVNNGWIKGSVLAAQLGVVANIPNIAINAKPVVISYNLIVVRNMKIVYGKNVEGARFDDEIKEQFSKLMAGDCVFIYDIIAKGPDNIERHIESISLKITE